MGKIIGVAGTAKNTGKTTTLMTLINLLKEEKTLTAGITGIGYDGENFDNVTGLPKPRIDVYEGMIVATADRCVKSAKAEIEVLLETQVRTPLGRIIVGKVKKPGKIVIAGPVRGGDLRITLDCMLGFGAQPVFVDGALGRVAPFTEADALILATGASRNSDINLLALETGSLLRLLGRSAMEGKGVTARFGSVLTKESFDSFVNLFSRADTMVVGGLFSGRFFGSIAENNALYGKRLLFDNPFKLLLAGEINATRYDLDKIENNIEIGVQKPVNVIAVTVNPYYPKYRYNSNDYEEAFVDKKALINAVQENLPVPCYNAVESPYELLGEILKLSGSENF
jgi:hypothetical protein